MKKLIGFALVALQGIALPAKDIEVMAVYYPHWHKYPKGMEWFGEKWDWSEAEWAFVKDPVVRFPGQINFKPFGGYYSGSDPKDVETEIALASNAGIDVFLYDYYWYDGEKTQEEAIEQGFLKAENRGKMKFALMWCYHDRRKSSWRKKFGGESTYCMRLARKPEEFLGLIDYSIAHYFNQPEHWRHNGKIFFSIYNAWDMIKDYGEEGTKSALLEARRRVRAAGLGEIEFNAQNLWSRTMTETAERCGFDSLTSYGCNTYSLPNHRQRYAAGERLFDFAEAEKVLDAKWKTMSSISKLPYYPIVPTGWDSSLRCAKDAKFPWPGPEADYPYCGIFTNATDALFEKYLRAAKEHALADPKKPGVVYINAWNEYTEGCWLLPDNRRGDLRLRAIARVFGRHPADEYVFTSNCRSWEKKPVNQPAKTMRAPDVENAKYGPHPRQGMDVWFPGKARPAADAAKRPALVVIHGGGWSAGDRIPGASGWEPICRKEGITLVSVGYRFIQDGRDEHLSPPVRAPLDDAIAAIRFIQAHADEWKIDVTRIGLTGGSAGACSSLYAALQNDCELGIRAVYAASPQTSLDPKETREWIPNARYGSGAFGYGTFDAWLAHRAECLPWIEKFSPAALLRACTAAKAPAFFYTCPAVPAGGALPKDPTHAGMFCVKFEEICRAKGIRCEKAPREAIIKALLD